MKADAVFEGGGVKGIAMAGAVTAFEEEGYQWNNLTGTSAGAITAALLAVGYTGKELGIILSNVNYKSFLDNNGKVCVFKKVLNLILKKGIYDTEKLEKWIYNLLAAKGKTKFKDISIGGESRLKIIAADITNRKMLILPDDSSFLGIDPMELSIAMAVRMSISIPFFFRPLVFKSKQGNNIIVDGGLLSNFPIWIYDVKGIPRWPTFGFRLFENDMSLSSKGKNDIISYFIDIVETVLERNEEMYLDDKNSVRTINIPTLGIKTTQFDITPNQCKELYKSGYKAAKEFIRSWDFKNYVNKHRINVNCKKEIG